MKRLATCALLFGFAGCGARTALEEDPCGDVDTARPCEDECGQGQQLCRSGSWSECVVAPQQLPCTNICGVGVAMCADGALGACEVAVRSRPCASACADGVETCSDGRWGPCSASEPLPPILEVRVRDFRDAHPDFEAAIGRDRAFVGEFLGPGDTPVYLGPSPTTSSDANFATWFRDVPGVNESVSIELPLTRNGDETRFIFDDREFFPIDARLFGNEGRPHNFHFTLEASASFVYSGGETFRFAGDDDVFVFINRRLAINLGGVHSREEASLSLDELADSFGLLLGETYDLHLFFAERHTDRSTFTIDTTISRTPRCE
ncbi:MAG: fibro-slime domain-containing protein [Polyangiales bacterium]